MDWKKFTDSVSPYLTKAKEYWQKAAEFAENQIQTTPLFIKTQEDYEWLILNKRAIILAYDDKNIVAKDIQLLSTIWLTRAFVDVAKCRFLSINEFPDLARNLWLVWPLDMRVRFEWEESYRITDIEEIKKWWKTPSYKKEKWVDVPVSNIDPLSAK